MPNVSRFESTVCRSAPWRAFTNGVVLPWALQGERPTGDVLEIGGGSGAMAAGVLGRFSTARMTVTDFDPAMIASATERLARFRGRVTVREADATRLPFEDATFDVVLSFIMLHHVVAWERALEEAVRVLRPGGRLIGYDLLSTRMIELFHQAEDDGVRLMDLGELRDCLAHLPIEAKVRPSLARFVARFQATKRGS